MARRRPLRHVTFTLGAVITLALLATAGLSLLYTPADPLAMSIGGRLQGPSGGHPFGTDQYGRVTEYRESERTPEGGLRFLARQILFGRPTLIRMTFTPIDRNTVRQFGETSNDDGKTWTTSFDLYYHRRLP